MESGIRTQKSLESGIQELGIRNPETRNPESGAWNPESTIRLDSLTWGRQTTKYSLSSHYKNYMRIMQFIVIDRHRILNLNYLTT